MAFPSINALRSFDAAARLGGFKAAASELGVSPTAVSHQIRGLEAQLGVALFERRTRRVVLTEAGRRLAESTLRAFRDLAEAVEELRAAAETLTLAATPAFAALWLAPRLGSFEARFPEIRVRVDSATERVDLERDRRIDLAIRYGAAEPRAARRLRIQERFRVYGAPALLERSDDPLAAEALIATEWREPGLARIGWPAWLSAAGAPAAEPGRMRAFDQEHHVVQAGLAGQGLILVSDVLVSDLAARGWLVPLRPEVALEGLGYTVLTRAGRAESRKIDRFLAWLAGELGAAA